MNHANQTGVTLVELITVVAILGVLLALAAPSFRDSRERRQTIGAAEAMAATISLARSEGIKRNLPVALEVRRVADDNWCVGLLADAAAAGCDCTATPATCGFPDGNGGLVPQVFSSADAGNAKLTALPAFGGDAILLFNPVHGSTVGLESGALSITSTSGKYGLNVSIGGTGNVTLCRSTTHKIGTYQACPP